MRFSPNPNRATMIRWYEWSDEAFAVAREQNKPVMLFLSAFWCRYCQRMDEEAFSQTENIALLRAYFISVRAENAQRPDIDVRYNQNGWPTIVFMTPTGQPIIAANYLPADQLQDLLLRVYMDHQNGDGLADTPSKSPSLEPEKPLEHPGVNEAGLAEITESIMALADRTNGGYGAGQKFIQFEANQFLLCRYKATQNPEYLNHVCFSLDRMWAQGIHDRREGGYFRTSTGPDWDQPHREKLLAEQAGLIENCLGSYQLTGHPKYASMAEEIVAYLNAKLYEPTAGAFYGCEDFLRVNDHERASESEFFTILDECIYTDANALAVIALLDAGAVLRSSECNERALRALDFLQRHMRNPAGGMFHFFDGSARLGGWLADQVLTGKALLQAHRITGERNYLAQALELAHFIAARFRNCSGGYFDTESGGCGYLNVQLTLIEQNGPAAAFFIGLAEVTGDSHWREAALWALSAFKEGLSAYGVHAAAFGAALSEYLESSSFR